MSELDTLRPEVVYALKFIEGVRLFVTSKQRIKKPEGDDLFDESVETIRAELLRLAEIEKERWGVVATRNAAIERAYKAEAELAALQARIDALMLEFCPEDMTEEQVAAWSARQRVVDEPQDNSAKEGRR